MLFSQLYPIMRYGVASEIHLFPPDMRTPLRHRLPFICAPGRYGRTLISNPHSTPVDWHNPNLDLSRHSATGVIGDPTHASADLGDRLWQASVDRVRSILLDISLGSLE